MTIPLVILLVALSLFVLLGFTLIVFGAFGEGNDEDGAAAILIGLALSIGATVLIGIVATTYPYSNTPTCHPSPASLAVEKTP